MGTNRRPLSFCSGMLAGSLAVAAAAAPQPNLMVDADRDGQITPQDQALEETFSKSQGALMLFNCDSDQDTGRPDHADAIVNGRDDVADLAIISMTPLPDLTPADLVTLTVDDAARPHVRIFIGEPSEAFTIDLHSQGNIDPRWMAMADDLNLMIEARSFATAEWDGTATITLTVEQPDGTRTSDSVTMGVAPFILLSNAKAGKEIYVREFPGENDRLIEQLGQIAALTGTELIVIPDAEQTPYAYNHIWVQDAMEIGYTEMPGVRLNVVLPSNRNKSIDNYPEDALLGPDYGWFRAGSFRPEFGQGEGGQSWIDWYGNLEVTPPLAEYPLGRIYYGIDGDASLNPDVVAMLEAQGVQHPVGLDVGWLLIKHVDEMVNFVPAKYAPKGFKVLVPDMNLSFDLLEQAVAQGNGDLEMLAPYANSFGYLRDNHPAVTVASLASDATLRRHAFETQRDRVEPMIDTLKSEFGLEEADLIRVPFLQSPDKATLMPNIVNSLVINGHLVISDPHGPRAGERDLLHGWLRERLAGLGLEIHFVDDAKYHRWAGNVHCATNVRREGFEPNWWSPLADNR